jgi:3-methyladenine DNA glycosylase/8-oxoguanine DNA glycosylase
MTICITTQSMNPTTAADSAAGVGSFGHLGCKFHDRAEFHTGAAAYIADGISDNHWIEFVGAGSREQLRAELTALPGIGDRHGVLRRP